MCMRAQEVKRQQKKQSNSAQPPRKGRAEECAFGEDEREKRKRRRMWFLSQKPQTRQHNRKVTVTVTSAAVTWSVWGKVGRIECRKKACSFRT